MGGVGGGRMSQTVGKHAVVVGAGMAGLAAAKALSAHFDRVSVLERDSSPSKPEARPGAPQARHLHVLLAGGLKALEQLFPDFERELEEAGATRLRLCLQNRVERPGFDSFPLRDIGFDLMSMSRPLIEFAVRRRVERVRNVALISGCRVGAIVASSDRVGVAAVRYDDDTGGGKEIAADLVVDASGRGALTLAFLESAGFPKVEETEIGIDQAYSTALFEIPPDQTPDWGIFLHSATAPASSRSAFASAIEGGAWIVSLGGNHGDAPPGDPEGFMAFVKGLRTSTLYDAIKGARRVGDISRFLLPASVRRHFEKLERYPRALIPIGDAVCRFNPVFGQGMSVAAQEAVLLDRLLAGRSGSVDPLDGLAPEYFANIQGALAAPWTTAEYDFVYPMTRGQRPPDFTRRMQYTGALMRLAVEDASVHRLLYEVNHLLKPATMLRAPEIASRVAALMAAPA
jgi:2-polyprenyl-6-methoxyphenol hydroxylase-like FAD-dependent oxidoreductase